MEKVLVEVYTTYGKGDGEELSETFVIENCKVEREKLVEEYDPGFFNDSYRTKDFIAGKSRAFNISLSGGDWDDPTGIEVVIKTKELALELVEMEYNRRVKEINSLFG